MKNIYHGEIKQILIVNLGGIGDLLLSMPALRAIRRQYPDAHIALLTIPRSIEIVKRSSYINEVFTYETGLKKFLDLILSLRRKSFDMVINMRTLASFRGTLKIWLLFLVLGAKYRVGRDTEGRGFFLNMKVPESYIGKKHDLEYNLDIAKILGAVADDKSLEFNLTNEELEFADNFLKSRAMHDNDILIGIAPGAPWPAKRWPLKNFAELIDRLSKLGYKAVIMGSREEEYLRGELRKIEGLNYISAVGETNIGQFAALMKRCSLQVTNDTGAMHIAVAVGTPVVAIFGPSHLETFDPRKISKNTAVLYKKVDCSPCEKVHCGSKKCLESITPEEAVKACLELLGRARHV